MTKLKVHRAFDEFLLDPNLSLRAKGFLTMVLTNNITHGIEIKEHCTDSMDDIKDTYQKVYTKERRYRKWLEK